MSATPVVTTAGHLSQERQRAVSEAADVARGHDSVAPLSEETLLRLHSPAPASGAWQHLLVDGPDGLAGYAHLDQSDPDAPWAELFVAPMSRHAGIGSALLRALLDAAPTVRVWAHGFLPQASAFALSRGLGVVRELWQMARPLTEDIAQPSRPLPPGYTITTFDPDDPRDERDWLAVNAAAFAHHPEQGRIDSAALRARMAEPWFDPAGFFLAVRSSTAPNPGAPAPEVATEGADTSIVGFHWTKHEAGAATSEVYVIGVDPTAGVRGLGTPLLGAGLRHLRNVGAREVYLYVEADNERALALYHRYGFTLVSADVMYAAPAPAGSG